METARVMSKVDGLHLHLPRQTDILSVICCRPRPRDTILPLLCACALSFHTLKLLTSTCKWGEDVESVLGLLGEVETRW